MRKANAMSLLFAIACVGCGRTNESSLADVSVDAIDAEDTAIDTEVRTDGCPERRSSVECKESELGKRCLYNECHSPTWGMYELVCEKVTKGIDPPYRYVWNSTDLPCPKDAGSD